MASGKPESRLLRIGDWGLDVEIPNPALQAWLNSEEARVALGKISREIQIAYMNMLPYRTENLRKGAFNGTKQAVYPGQSQRYYAWVGNRALSYRKRKGQPYPRFIEYGKANIRLKPGFKEVKTKFGKRVQGAGGRFVKREVAYERTGTRTGGGYQLHNAALQVAERMGGAAMRRKAFEYLGGQDFNPEHHIARPAPNPTAKREADLRASMEDPVRRADRMRRERAARSRENLRRGRNIGSGAYVRMAPSHKEWANSPDNPNSPNYVHRERD